MQLPNNAIATSHVKPKNAAIPPLAESEHPKPQLNEKIVNEHFDKLNELVAQSGNLERKIRTELREMLDIGIPEHLGVKPTGLLERVNTDEVTERHVRRYLQAVITEREIGLPVNTLLESHAREFDKLETPEEKKQAYGFAIDSAGQNRLTATHFKAATEKVIALRLTNSRAKNEPFLNGTTKSKAKPASKKYTAIGVFETLTKNSEPGRVPLIREILANEKELRDILLRLLSEKFEATEKAGLLQLLNNWK